jgi:hypothetical protein
MYLLDYGWSEPLIDAVHNNFSKMADAASRNDAVVLRGVPGVHFADEVLSWHNVNGEPGEEILPAILITTRHPQDFQQQMVERHGAGYSDDALLLIPLRKVCKSSNDVVPLIEMLFADIASKKRLPEFHIARELKAGKGRALVDALVLEPNISGVGVDLQKLVSIFDSAWKGRRRR